MSADFGDIESGKLQGYFGLIRHYSFPMKMGKDPINCSSSLVFLFQRSISHEKALSRLKELNQKRTKVISFVFLLKLCDPANCAELCLNGKVGSLTAHRDEHTCFSILIIPKAQQVSAGGYRGSSAVLQVTLLKGQQQEQSILKHCALKQGDAEEI